MLKVCVKGDLKGEIAFHRIFKATPVKPAVIGLIKRLRNLLKRVCPAEGKKINAQVFINKRMHLKQIRLRFF